MKLKSLFLMALLTCGLATQQTYAMSSYARDNAIVQTMIFTPISIFAYMQYDKIQKEYDEMVKLSPIAATFLAAPIYLPAMFLLALASGITGGLALSGGYILLNNL